jgi:tripeptide aminopeptidase
LINTQRLVDTFLELVQIDSPSGHEQAIGQHLAAKFQALGLETALDAAGNLLARRKGNSSNTLLLSAHMDTVGSDTGIKPVIRDGVIYSDGTTILGADDKSGIATILEVLSVLNENDWSHPPLEVVISTGEEQGLQGARHFDTAMLSASYGIVMDAGGLTGHIVVSAPAQNSLVFTVHGRASHAGSEPEKGINAIRVASEAIASIPLGRIDLETTSNIGIIQGGSARNIVPAQVKVVGETRSRDTAKLDRLTAEIVDAFHQAAARHKTSADAQVTRAYEAYQVPKDTPIVRVVMGAASDLGHEIMLRSSGGGTDGNIFNAAGIPSIVLSTGMAEVHTTSEHIAIADMAAGTQLLLETVRRLAIGSLD